MIQHHSPISGVAAFDSKWVATAGYDNQVILWDARSQESLSRVSHDHLANACQFSPDGKWLVTASSDHTARLYSVPDLKLKVVFSDHQDDVEMAVFNASGTKVATASRDKTIRIYDLKGQLEAELRGHTADVLSVVFEAGDSTLVSTSDDGTIRRWSESGDALEIIDLGGIETDTIVLSPEGLIIAGNDEGQILLVTGNSRRRINCHEAGIKRLAFDSARRRLLSVSYDRRCKIWDLTELNDLSLRHEISLPNLIWPRSCAFLSSDQIVFATFGSSYAKYDLSSATWDLNHVHDTQGKNAVSVFEGEVLSIGDAGVLFRGEKPITRVGSLCNFILPVHGRVLTGGQSGAVFEGSTGAVVYQYSMPLNCGVAFQSDGKHYAAIGTYVGTVLVFEIPKHGPISLAATVKMHQNAIKGISAGASELFTVSANREAACIKATSLLSLNPQPEWLRTEAHEKIANGCCALGEGRFASVSRDLKLRIWDSQDGSVTVYSTPHTHSIKCMAVDASGTTIVTGSYNGTVAAFDVERAVWTVATRPTTSGISSIAPGKNGFFAASYDGKIYDIPNR